MESDESPDIEQAIKSIKAQYKLGKRILKKCGMIAKPRMMKELAEKADINTDTAHPGDVVWFSPGEKHLHGATPTTDMPHIAIQEELDGITAEWLEHVTDEQDQG